MKNIEYQLKVLSSNFPLIENFDWEIPKNCPINIPNEIKNNFKRNIYLKENMSESLISDVDMKNHYWIVQDWGGIKSLKKNDRNDKKIEKFKQQLIKEKLTKENFNLISSFSKIASFINPDKFAIYDSRVIYSLNWLLFRYSDDRQFFPQPTGRSAALAKYDMQTIFRLSKNGYTYRSHKTAFFEYCDLLRKLSKSVFGDEKPYRIEMLLFLIAPEYIVNDIADTVSLSVK